MTHVIQALAPLNHITATLNTLSDLPAALENIAVMQETFTRIGERAAARSRPNEDPTSASIDGPALLRVIQNLSDKVSTMEARADSLCENTANAFSRANDDNSHVDGAPSFNDQIPNRQAVCAFAMGQQHIVSAQTTTVGTEAGNTASASARANGSSEPSSSNQPTSASQIRLPVSRPANTPGQQTPACGLIPPTPVTASARLPTHGICDNASKPVDQPSSTRPVSRSQLIHPDSSTIGFSRQQVAQSTATDKTPDDHQDEPNMLADGPEDDESPAFPMGLLFPQQRLSASRSKSITTYQKSHAKKRKTFSNLPTSLAMAVADQVSGTNTPALSSLSNSSTADQRKATTANVAATSDNVTTGLGNQAAIEFGDPDQSAKIKRQKSNNTSLKMKREGLNEVYGAVQHHTRAKVNEAREVGVDLLGLVDSQISSRSTTGSSTATRRGSAGKGGRKGKAVTKVQPETATIEDQAQNPAASSLKAIGPGPSVLQHQSVMPETAATVPHDEESIEYIETDFGHGQPLSAPSIPHPWSTSETLETQEPTLETVPADAHTETTQPKQSTSTDRVDQSPSLALAPAQMTATGQAATTVTSAQPARRPPPSYRRFQALSSKARQEDKNSGWLKGFSAMDSDDDD